MGYAQHENGVRTIQKQACTSQTKRANDHLRVSQFLNSFQILPVGRAHLPLYLSKYDISFLERKERRRAERRAEGKRFQDSIMLTYLAWLMDEARDMPEADYITYCTRLIFGYNPNPVNVQIV